MTSAAEVWALTAANLAVNVSVIVMCACRLYQLPRAPRALFSRLVFVFIIATAFCSGLRGPLFGAVVTSLWPILAGFSLALLMLEELFGWRRHEDAGTIEAGENSGRDVAA